MGAVLKKSSTSESVPAVLAKEFRGGFIRFDTIGIAQGMYKWKLDPSINVKRDSLGQLQEYINSIGGFRILSFSRTQGFPRETEIFPRVTSSLVLASSSEYNRASSNFEYTVSRQTFLKSFPRSDSRKNLSALRIE